MEKFKSYRCSLCGKVYEPHEATYTCPADGGNLDIILDYQGIKKAFSPEKITASKEQSIWRYLPLLPLAGAETDFQPVYVGDVAQAFCAALAEPRTRHQVYQLGGPQIYALADLVRLAGKLSGHPRPVFAIPDWAARIQAALFALLPGEPLISGDNLDSMKVDNVVDPAIQATTAAALGIKLTPLEAVAPRYLASKERFDDYRARAGR